MHQYLVLMISLNSYVHPIYIQNIFFPVLSMYLWCLFCGLTFVIHNFIIGAANKKDVIRIFVKYFYLTHRLWQCASYFGPTSIIGLNKVKTLNRVEKFTSGVTASEYIQLRYSFMTEHARRVLPSIVSHTRSFNRESVLIFVFHWYFFAVVES